MDLRPGPHRRAEARAGRGRALDGDDECRGSSGPEVLVRELAAQEDAVLYLESRDLAGPNPQERDRRGVGRGLLEAERPGSMSARDRQIGRKRETLPGGRADGVAEYLPVRSGLQPVAPGRLLVVPPCREVRSRLDLVVDDRALSDGGADDATTGLLDALDQGAEVRAGQEPLPGRGRVAGGRVSDHGSGDLLRDATRGTRARTSFSGRIGREVGAGSREDVGRQQ